jgi:hypothetical protein
MWCPLQVSETERRFGQRYVGRIIWCSVGMHGGDIVSVVTGWEHHGLSLNPKRGRLFSFCHLHIQISSVAHPFSYPMGTRDKVAGAWADGCHPLQLRLICVELYLRSHIHLYDTVLNWAQGELYLYWHLCTVRVLIMHILNMNSLILILYFAVMKEFFFKKRKVS